MIVKENSQKRVVSILLKYLTKMKLISLTILCVILNLMTEKNWKTKS